MHAKIQNPEFHDQIILPSITEPILISFVDNPSIGSVKILKHTILSNV
jgi:hypothetical protein